MGPPERGGLTHGGKGRTDTLTSCNPITLFWTASEFWQILRRKTITYWVPTKCRTGVWRISFNVICFALCGPLSPSTGVRSLILKRPFYRAESQGSKGRLRQLPKVYMVDGKPSQAHPPASRPGSPPLSAGPAVCSVCLSTALSVGEPLLPLHVVRLNCQSHRPASLREVHYRHGERGSFSPGCWSLRMETWGWPNHLSLMGSLCSGRKWG